MKNALENAHLHLTSHFQQEPSFRSDRLVSRSGLMSDDSVTSNIWTMTMNYLLINYWLKLQDWRWKHDLDPHTCVWIHRKVWVPLTDAVDQLGAVPVHTVVSVYGRDLDDRCTWKTEGYG